MPAIWIFSEFLPFIVFLYIKNTIQNMYFREGLESCFPLKEVRVHRMRELTEVGECWAGLG
jgi:hypothetical protein